MLSERAKGVLLMVGASVCFSTAGVVVRHIETVNAVGIVFWRSVFMSVFLAALLAAWHGRALPMKLRLAGAPGLVSAAFLGATFFFFIFSISYTTVANAAALMSTGPLFLAAAAWAWLGERPRAGTWAAIAAALAGIALMFSDGLGGGQLVGNLLALMVPVSFTINYIVLRRAAKSVDPTVSALIAALLSALVGLPLAWPLAASGRDLALLAALGFFQTGLGLALMTRAYHRLQAGELALIGLLESVLAPIWVWLAIGERPGNAALAGGVIVIGAVLANQLLGLRPRKAGAAAAETPRG